MPGSQHSLLQKLLLRHNRRNSRLWLSLLAVCTGTTLLLLSVMIWWNFKELLEGKRDNDSLGSTFLTVSKRVTDEKMGRPEITLFTLPEIDDIRHAPQVQDIGALQSNRFPVFAVMSASVGFSTEMFLEAVPQRFMDNMPEDWQWQPGDMQVPIIVSTEFLNLYNYGFALSQGLPQLSESSIQSISFDLKIGATETYKAHVVGFSDRISSVLVPESFIQYGNNTYAPGAITAPSRLIVKSKDPSDAAFVNYLQQHDYTTNNEMLRWNKLRSAIQAVTSATGLLAVLLMGIGTLVFILFIELTIARAQASLKLLLEIGYSPRYLGRYMTARFMPLICSALAISLVLAVAFQYIASVRLQDLKLAIAPIPGWPVWAAFGISGAILLSFVVVSIRRAINNN